MSETNIRFENVSVVFGFVNQIENEKHIWAKP